ncbi:MAG TPA: restriction endonuclease [Bryobacteraceae bacterium]|nr:restriction endonuclease [Bryobacteraceae bacterium]
MTGPFELIDRPDWAEAYLSLRAAQKLPCEVPFDHVADVVQTWPVGDWEELPFAGVPRWISYRLLSRNTAGIVANLQDPAVSALKAIEDLMSRPRADRYQPIREEAGLEQGLMDWVSPMAFEHLVVALLQLEAVPGVYWHHTGGSGDGGVDGIGVNADGQVVGVVQCKWQFNGSVEGLVRALRDSLPEGQRRIELTVAVLSGVQDETVEDARFLNRRAIADLVWKHRNCLPQARAFGLAERL